MVGSSLTVVEMRLIKFGARGETRTLTPEGPGTCVEGFTFSTEDSVESSGKKSLSLF